MNYADLIIVGGTNINSIISNGDFGLNFVCVRISIKEAVKELPPKSKLSLDISHQISVLMSASSCPGFQTSCLALNFFVKFSAFISAAIHPNTIKFSLLSFTRFSSLLKSRYLSRTTRVVTDCSVSLWAASFAANTALQSC